MYHPYQSIREHFTSGRRRAVRGPTSSNRTRQQMLTSDGRFIFSRSSLEGFAPPPAPTPPPPRALHMGTSVEKGDPGWCGDGWKWNTTACPVNDDCWNKCVKDMRWPRCWMDTYQHEGMGKCNDCCAPPPDPG